MRIEGILATNTSHHKLTNYTGDAGSGKDSKSEPMVTFEEFLNRHIHEPKSPVVNQSTDLASGRLHSVSNLRWRVSN